MGLYLFVEKEVVFVPRYLWWFGEWWWGKWVIRDIWVKVGKKWKKGLVWLFSMMLLGLDVLESDFIFVVECDYCSKYEGGFGIVFRSCY